MFIGTQTGQGIVLAIIEGKIHRIEIMKKKDFIKYVNLNRKLSGDQKIRVLKILNGNLSQESNGREDEGTSEKPRTAKVHDEKDSFVSDLSFWENLLDGKPGKTPTGRRNR